MDPRQVAEWALGKDLTLSVKFQVSQDESTHETTGHKWKNFELEIVSPSTLLQHHFEKAVWAAFSMRIRYIFICDSVNFIIEYIA